ncbi:hypothetical protein [Cohnella rhizosphaerae]|uniref:Uncharacterized protein n=1 Tax=Cohnella rhizosphaerae TaxID=1457232 RepID=A0A9X4KYY0_9BACL|nr:hypothetical protein [Cohnella rhizosphaerae]MDG0813870.1 hypothetical protein [Cohnella rhizosphaerae]
MRFASWGELMMDYDPLLAERLLAVCPADASGFGSMQHDDVWRLMLEGETASNAGTPPRLRSAKFTGYGIVLRSAAGTSGEMSVHMQQIDEGPNYRWGRSGDGGNGVIYYYANGKRYSYNRPEDVGDDNMGTGEGSSTFAVLDGHEYKSIGRRELTGPLHDFGFAQFAELNAGPDAQPHYRSRSVLMSGNDYIAIYDEVADMRVRGALLLVRASRRSVSGHLSVEAGRRAVACVIGRADRRAAAPLRAAIGSAGSRTATPTARSDATTTASAIF